jgi:ribosome recycling factor
VSEDDVTADLKTLDEVTKEFIDQIDAITKTKETELTTI